MEPQNQPQEVVAVVTTCLDCRKMVEEGKWPHIKPPYGQNMVEFLTERGQIIELCLQHSIQRGQSTRFFLKHQ